MLWLLLLLLKEVHSAQAETHHVRRHHVREHVREAEGRQLLMVATSSGTELLQALKLSLSLSCCLRLLLLTQPLLLLLLVSRLEKG